MMQRVLGWLGWILILVLALAAALYSQRNDPIGWLAGRGLSGPVVNEPVTDWSFSNQFQTVAIETRPAAPHSVTTVCFVADGKLYIPAQAAPTKSWTYYASVEPRVRVKIGDQIYPGIATRVTDDAEREAVRKAAQAKYDFPASATPPADLWLFRIDSPGTETATPAETPVEDPTAPGDAELGEAAAHGAP